MIFSDQFELLNICVFLKRILEDIGCSYLRSRNEDTGNKNTDSVAAF